MKTREEKNCLLVYVSERKEPWELKKEESLKNFLEEISSSKELPFQFNFHQIPLIEPTGDTREVAQIIKYLVSLKNKLSAIGFVIRNDYSFSPADHRSLKYIMELFNDFDIPTFIVLTSISLKKIESYQDSTIKKFNEMMKKIKSDWSPTCFFINLGINHEELSSLINSLTQFKSSLIHKITQLESPVSHKEVIFHSNLLEQHSKLLLSHQAVQFEIIQLEEESYRNINIAEGLLAYLSKLPDIEIELFIPRPRFWAREENTKNCYTYFVASIATCYKNQEDQEIITWCSKALKNGTPENTLFRNIFKHLDQIEKRILDISQITTWLEKHDTEELVYAYSLFLIRNILAYSSLIEDEQKKIPIDYVISALNFNNQNMKIESRECKNKDDILLDIFSEKEKLTFNNITFLTKKCHKYAKAIQNKQEIKQDLEIELAKAIVMLTDFCDKYINPNISNFLHIVARENISLFHKGMHIYNSKMRIDRFRKISDSKIYSNEMKSLLAVESPFRLSLEKDFVDKLTDNPELLNRILSKTDSDLQPFQNNLAIDMIDYSAPWNFMLSRSNSKIMQSQLTKELKEIILPISVTKPLSDLKKQKIDEPPPMILSDSKEQKVELDSVTALSEQTSLLSKKKKKKRKDKKKKMESSNSSQPLKNSNHKENGDAKYTLATECKDTKQAILYFTEAFAEWRHIRNKDNEFIKKND